MHTFNEDKNTGKRYLKLHANWEIKSQNAAVTGYCNEKSRDLFARREFIVMLH
jgi:hypothetical protein